MYFCSFVIKCNQAIKHPSNIHQMYSCFYRTVTHREFHKIFTSPCTSPPIPALTQGFPTFHYRTSSFCCLPFFFLILIIFNSKTPPKDKYFNRSWQAFLHIIFLLQTKFPLWSPIFSPKLEHPLKGTCSFNRP